MGLLPFSLPPSVPPATGETKKGARHAQNRRTRVVEVRLDQQVGLKHRRICLGIFMALEAGANALQIEQFFSDKPQEVVVIDQQDQHGRKDLRDRQDQQDKHSQDDQQGRHDKHGHPTQHPTPR
jgi:hypothetical protein